LIETIIFENELSLNYDKIIRKVGNFKCFLYFFWSVFCSFKFE